MKKLMLITLLNFAIFSCAKEQKEDDFNVDQFPQKWELIKMTGQIQNSEMTGNDMNWQEYYVLNEDGTFTKSRDRDGIKTVASGTFKVVDQVDGKYFQLFYTTKSAIIGSCTSDDFESLWLKSNNQLLGTWSYCDGPGLEYKRIEI